MTSLHQNIRTTSRSPPQQEKEAFIIRHCYIEQSILAVKDNRKTLREEVQAACKCYYISSPDPRQPFNVFIRNHWEVENKPHRTSDMVFREDEQRKRTKHAAENFALVRKIALNILKKDAGKESLRSKSLKAAWNKDYLIKFDENLMR
jgi:predicted transposase YbfD/YdcC